MNTKKIFLLTLFLTITGLTGWTQGKLTPVQVLDNVIGLIKQSKGSEAKFVIYNSGYSGGGIVKVSGQKFNVRLPDVEVWYNGKELYTYNARTEETTLVAPTPEDLSDSNPLAYVTNARNNYNVTFSTVKKSGKYVLELIPKVKNDEIKRITLTVRNTDYVPEKIVVEPPIGSPITADITGFRTSLSISPKDFDYPKTKYPKVEIIDLR